MEDGKNVRAEKSNGKGKGKRDKGRTGLREKSATQIGGVGSVE
jgi:hypothetical protein